LPGLLTLNLLKEALETEFDHSVLSVSLLGTDAPVNLKRSKPRVGAPTLSDLPGWGRARTTSSCI